MPNSLDAALPVPNASIPFTDADLSALASWQEDVRWRGVDCLILADHAPRGFVELCEIIAGGRDRADWRLWRAAEGEIRLADLHGGVEHRVETVGDAVAIVQAAIKCGSEKFPAPFPGSILSRLPAWLVNETEGSDEYR